MSNRIEFFLIVSIFVLLNRYVLADPPYYNCSTEANFTVASPFHDNRDNLLSSLSINASTLNFSEFSVGNGKDKVYGNFLCYSTVSSKTCQNCMKTAVKDIKRLCPNNMEAIVWEENCQLRYSNVKFFGVMDYTTGSNTTLFNKQNISDPDGFREFVKDFMRNLSRVAAFGSSSKRYALEEDKKYTVNENVSGLVQCTRDLSRNDCNICLQKVILDIQTCCYFYTGARVLSRSCYLRYELYHLTEALALPGEPNKRQSNRLSIIVILVIAASALVVIFLFSWLCHYIYGRQKQKESTIELTTREVYQNDVVTPIRTNSLRQRDEMSPKDFPLITLATINEITNHFSDLNILGQGGFGPVYKGVLSDGKEVAVKRLSISSEQGSEEFMNEIILIMKLQHKNLVKLLGCCIEKEEKILVYEYMPNRSLDVFIFDSQRRAQLNWRKRLDIITGIARGLLYLHQDSRLRIIHRDLKASNVLLDENLNPKISDFGMARIFGGNHGEEANTKIIVGTYGYMAPEYAMEGLYSTKSDVYSFGVLLIEIVTGKRNARSNLSRSAPSLLAYAWQLWNEGNVFELIDPLIIESCSATAIQFQRYINIGLLCVQEDANTRPSMSSVIVMLVNDCVPLRQPLRPAFSVVRIAAQSDQNLDCSINGLTTSSISPR